MADLSAAKLKAYAPLIRLGSVVDQGHAVAMTADEAGAILAYVAALESALPSVGKATDLEATCSACGGRDDGCELCDGVGTIPTAAGQKVIDLIFRRFKDEG